LGKEVVGEQDGVQKLCEIFSADYGQFFDNFTGDEIVDRGFFWIEVIKVCLDISSCEAGDRRFKLVGVSRNCEWFLLPQVWNRRDKVEIWRLHIVRMRERLK
jgi:hypothetical protein